ncbi:putative reverse transcriptase domain-containing protein, partial [Tanacetum coccineum]
IMPPRMRTQSAGWFVAESRGGGTGERVGRGGRGRGPRGGNDERVDELNGQGNGQGLGANGNVEGVNGNVEGVNGGVGGAPNFWTIIAQQLQNLLPAILAQIRTLSQEVTVSMSWNDFKLMLIEEFCPSHEMQKLETELGNHAMVGASHAAYTDKFHELARLVPHLVTLESRNIERYVYGFDLQICGMVEAMEPKTMQKSVQIFGALTDKAVWNRSIKKVEKRGNVGEPSKDKNGRDDNKRTRTGNAFAMTTNHVGRENTSVWPKRITCNSYHAPGGPCRMCFNCNRPGHLVRDCSVMPRNANPVNVKNPTPARGACHECGSTDHFRPACPRLNKAQGPGGNHPNPVATNNGGQSHGNQWNQVRGRAFMLGVEEARQDPNIVTGIDPSELGFRYEIEIASGQLVEIDKVIHGYEILESLKGVVFMEYWVNMGKCGTQLVSVAHICTLELALYLFLYIVYKYSIDRDGDLSSICLNELAAIHAIKVRKGRAIQIETEEARQDPNIVTGTFILNNNVATTLFDSGADYSFVSTTFIPLLGIEPSELGFRYEIEIASGQLVEIDKVIKGCKLEIKGHVFDIDLIPFGHGSFDVIIRMDWLSNHKAKIVCHEKVVRIPILDGQVLRVLRERPEEKARLLMSAKASNKKQGEVIVVRDFPEVFPLTKS